MIRSLRWRLQLWHALLLTTVLIIFGGVVHALQWQTRLQQTDSELDHVASRLSSRLRGLFPVPRMPTPGTRPQRNPGRTNPPQRPSENENAGSGDVADALFPANAPTQNVREIPGGPPWAVFRDGARDSFWDGFRDAVRDGNRPGRDTVPRDPSGRNSRFGPPPGLGLPEDFRHQFETDEKTGLYFIIWDRNGTLLEKSKSVGEIPFPDLHTPNDGLPVQSARMRDMHREVIHVSRFDINVLVGRSIESDLAAHRRSGMLLILTGLGVLVIGLAGGWWFSSWAIRPIADITAIAESISVKNLSTRINVQSTATELEQLATVLNRTFDRLQSAFERQGQFTADASHELRTPLSVILSHAELVLLRPRSSEEYQQAFQACRRASLRMKALIDALLLLARFDSGEPEVERRPVELGRLGGDAVEMLQRLAEERQVTINCQADPVTIEADYEQMFQLLTNLLGNSIRYNRTGGRVDLEITSDGKFAIIRVSDTGVGIPADDLPRIFDRFYRVDKARSREEGGCGLGLAICQTIVESHHGTISAASEPDQGTTIEVRLPLGHNPTHSDLPASRSSVPDSEPATAGAGR